MDTVYRRYTNEVMNECLSVEVSWELSLYTLNDLVLYIWKFKRLKCHSDKGQARIWKLCCGSHQIYFTVRKEETSLAALLMKYARILQTFIKIRWIQNMLFCNGQFGARYILTDRENETNYHYSLQMIDRSTYFLNNTEKFLDNWVKLGQDTCHRTHGYDAEKCYQDCKERESSDFAKQCRKDGGFYKCCIRYIFSMNKVGTSII